MTGSRTTEEQFEDIISKCRNLFLAKMKDYGSSWRILRVTSLTDQIFIKANRIRSIESKGVQRVDEGVGSEYTGIINYSVIALIQLELGTEGQPDLPVDIARSLYDKHLYAARDLMLNKNHDYSEAWKDMRLSSITDIILMKLMRIRQIEDNQGKTIVSEGVAANYHDIINYSIFALIKLEE